MAGYIICPITEKFKASTRDVTGSVQKYNKHVTQA